MITLIPKSPGTAGHWLVNYPAATRFEAKQHKDRTRLDLKIFGGRRGLLQVAQVLDAPPVFVAIALPIGKWKIETSDGAKRWFDTTTLESRDTGSAFINFTLDGQPSAVRYSRITKV